MTCKENLNTRRRSKALKSSLKSKLSKKITLLKSLFWRMKFQNSKQPTHTKIHNFRASFKKIEIWKIDTKLNLKTWLARMIVSEKEFWNLNKWTKLKLRIFKKNTAISMLKEQQVSRNSIKEKLDFYWKKSTEKNGS